MFVGNITEFDLNTSFKIQKLLVNESVKDLKFSTKVKGRGKGKGNKKATNKRKGNQALGYSN